jgi:hypothetical protein
MANPNLQQEQADPNKIVSSIMELFNPVSSKMQDAFRASEALRPIDPETFQSIQAGNLASAESLASSNMWAMTPEMFKMAMDQRPDLMKQAGQVTSLSDALLGRSTTRASMEKLAVEEARMGQQAVEGELDRRSREAISGKDNAAALKRTQMQVGSQEKLAAMADKRARDLARISMSGGYGETYRKLAAAGVPLHDDKTEAAVNAVLKADPRKMDPTTLAQNKFNAIRLGIIGNDGQPVKIKTKDGWFSNRVDTYQTMVNKKTGNRHVMKVEDDGSLIDMGLVSVKVPSGNASSRGSISGPASYFDELSGEE